MAGSLALVASEREENSMIAIKATWEIHYSRFIVFPSLSSICSYLIPRRPQHHGSKGTWISSSSSVSLQLVDDRCKSDVLLTVYSGGRIIEEHFVSKMHFSWPQVSCVSGYPARGSRAVFVFYRDSIGEVQKFALRFSTIYEVDTFMNALKEILKDVKDIELPNNDIGSEISSQSEFMSSVRTPNRAHGDPSITTPVHSSTSQMPSNLKCDAEPKSQDDSTYRPTYSTADELRLMTPFRAPQLSSSLNYEVEEHSCAQEAKLKKNSEVVSTVLPPSFTSLLTNCCSEVEQAAVVPLPLSGQVLKSEIARYLEDSSFHDMLVKVEKVINEMGCDFIL